MSEPIKKFKTWLEAAEKNKAISEPTATCLATTASDGQPSARMVLLKTVNEHGFVFYTNLESQKSRELRQNPKAALCFYWMPMDRQVRVEGHIEQVSDAEADTYFATRARDSRIGAWASKQSEPLSGLPELMTAVAKETARFGMGEIPRPPHWSGWRLIPEKIEFWQEGKFRLHEREVFTRKGKGWEVQTLYP